MAGSVNTNLNSLAAVQALTDISNSLSKTQANIQSGLKVGTASDNPAVFTIAQGLRSNIASLTAVTDTLATGVATVQGATSGATSISDSLKALRKTVLQAEGQSGTALIASQGAINGLLENINSFAIASTINGVNLLDGGSTGPNALVSGAKSVAVLSNLDGSATNVGVTASINTVGLALTDAGGVNVTALTLADGSEAAIKGALTLIDAAISTVGSTLTTLGAGTVKLLGLLEFTGKLSDSTTTSLGAFVDANLSEESAKLASLQTKQSLAIQSLSLANQGPSSLLQLFR